MSEDEGSGNSNESGLSVMYRCRHCPGAEFTAEERDIHRLTHRKGHQRGESPPLTLFQPITVVDEEPSSGGVVARGGIRSRKSYNRFAFVKKVAVPAGGGSQRKLRRAWKSKRPIGLPEAATGRSRPEPDKRKSVKHHDDSVNRRPRKIGG